MAVVKRRRWANVFLVVSVVLAVIAVAFAADTIATTHTFSQLICKDTISSVLQYGSVVLTAALAVWLSAKESREVRAEDRQREVAAHGIAAQLSVERELGSAVPATLAPHDAAPPLGVANS